MVDTATVHGGSRKVTNALSPAERQAAINALAKLTNVEGASRGVSSVFGGGLKSATLQGGSVLTPKVKTVGGSTLVPGKGSDTYAGGVTSGVKPAIHSIGSDTVVAGSAFGKAELAPKSGVRALTVDTIHAAGATAAGVKTATEDKSVGHKITMADKTKITLNGIVPHNTNKPH